MVQKLNSLRWKFTAGTKAKANEVNENFTQLLNKDNELIDAIDTINTNIADVVHKGTSASDTLQVANALNSLDATVQSISTDINTGKYSWKKSAKIILDDFVR